MLDVSTRNRHAEVMDSPQLDESRHRLALEALQRINRLSMSAAHVWRAVEAMAADVPGRLRVLDLACGGGDVAVALERRARRSGARLDVHGCDVSAVAVARARERAAAASSAAEFFVGDVVEDALPDGFDIIYSTLFLHHLDEAAAVDLLARMKEAARRGVVIQDLVRSRAGYALAWLGVHALTRSDVARTDGPLSVRAAFTPGEMNDIAQRAGLAGATTRRCWPQRFTLTWTRP